MRRKRTPLVAASITLVSACGAPDRGEEPTREATQEELEAVLREVQPIIDEELAEVDACEIAIAVAREITEALWSGNRHGHGS